MQQTQTIQNEKDVARAFNRQSTIFDELYAEDGIIHYKRERVRRHVLSFLPLHSNILELNAGTGEDAVYFAKLGHRVHATDISEGMQLQILQKSKLTNTTENITTELCSFTNLEALKAKGPYDMIFSNFAGLNCTNELNDVLGSFESLVKPGGFVTLVVLPKFCLWETALLLKGKCKTATRRFFSGKGRKAQVEGVRFTCWYHSPQQIRTILSADFIPVATEGLCTIVPPSYIEKFDQKYPLLFKRLCTLENRNKSKWPWRNIGDYFIITLQKKSGGFL